VLTVSFASNSQSVIVGSYVIIFGLGKWHTVLTESVRYKANSFEQPLVFLVNIAYSG